MENMENMENIESEKVIKKILKPEILAPAGDLEKLKVAITYGADAVYLGGEQFSLRAKAKNFGIEEMEQGVQFAHERGAKVYVTANIFAHNDDFTQMEEYFADVERIGADALIVADPGVFALARRVAPNLDIHISTQANNTNYSSALFWQSLGAKRIVVARELSASSIKEIVDKVPKGFEIEAFVHGAMCISYSGRCLLSNYMTNRDANKGTCAQPCRWEYNLIEKSRPNETYPVFEDEKGTYIFNSKDLCLIQNIPELVAAGISSFKIEGRMKTSYYVAAVVNAYRTALDDYFADPLLYESKKEQYVQMVKKTSHRHFTTGFYFGQSDETTQIYDTSSYVRNYDYVAVVLDYNKETKIATLEQRNKFSLGDEIQILRAKRSIVNYIVTEMQNENGEDVESAPHAQQILKMHIDVPLEKFDIFTKQVEVANE